MQYTLIMEEHCEKKSVATITSRGKFKYISYLV